MKKVVFCDFDGTITLEDTVDKFLEIYADSSWQEIEKLWVEKKIGSMECLERQLSLVKNITLKDVKDFCKSIKIDEGFVDLIEKINKLDYEFFILSDGFDLFIKEILENKKITNKRNIKVISNKLIVEKDKLKAYFPFSKKGCESGVCKCSFLESFKDYEKIYIGDGHSDFCASFLADKVFAKGKLASYLKEKGKSFTEFSLLKDIINEL